MRSRSPAAAALVCALSLVASSSFAAPPKLPAPLAAAPKPSAKAPTAAKPAPRAQDSTVRRQVAGGPTLDDASSGADTPDLRALRAAERELFPPASPNAGLKWPDELPFPVAPMDDQPRVHASGLPPAPPPSAPPMNEGGKDLTWLGKLDMPDIPVRWDARVVRYLEFYKDDPRGRGLLATWFRRSGRYREAIKKVLKRKGMPEDLVWLAMIESGFEPIARSPVGAMGLWQFMPETGKIYGLSQDRWADLRLNVPASTEAACDFLGDLYRRFGSWDLAMAAYNLGYGGMLAAVRRYNTNDFWALAHMEGSLPWETSLYVPKILAAAVVAHNMAVFGLQDVTPDAPLDGDDVPVAGGTPLASVATACGASTKEIEQLNPELRASRTPPSQDDYTVKVPFGKAAGCAQSLSKKKPDQAIAGFERYVVRFGETVDQIAQSHRMSVNRLVEINSISPSEVVRGGTVLLVPKGSNEQPPPVQADAKKTDGKTAVIVPEDVFVYPDRRRVFYRVQVGDAIPEVCAQFGVTADELRRWNGVDPSARLVDGMTLQLFVARDQDLSHAVVMSEGDVRPIVAGGEEFFQHWDDKGRRRVVVQAKAGETIESIGRRSGVSAGLMERINRRGRSETLSEGETVVLWLPGFGATHDGGGGALAQASHGIEPAAGWTATPPLVTQ